MITELIHLSLWIKTLLKTKVHNPTKMTDKEA